MSYGGSSTVSVPAGVPKSTTGTAGSKQSATSGKHDCGCGGSDPHQCTCNTHHHVAPSSQPDFARMTVAEKLSYNKAKRDRIFG
jgi:hypothetical protein